MATISERQIKKRQRAAYYREYRARKKAKEQVELQKEHLGRLYDAIATRKANEASRQRELRQDESLQDTRRSIDAARKKAARQDPEQGDAARSADVVRKHFARRHPTQADAIRRADATRKQAARQALALQDIDLLSNNIPKNVAPHGIDVWPTKLAEDDRLAIAQEFFEATSAATMATEECSFCGKEEQKMLTRRIPVSNLDISILESSIRQLRQRWEIGTILTAFKEATVDAEGYRVCQHCFGCIRRKKFIQAPLYSYANGCWIGDVPPELQGLTFMEEQCIALARATRCMFKLKQGDAGQTAASGNVCVFAQDPRNLVEILPPPLDELYDEVAVVFLKSTRDQMELENLAKTPLLLRRGRVLAALQWLIANNRLYRSVQVNQEALNDYPDSGPIPVPVTCQFAPEVLASEGSSYVSQANSVALDPSAQIPIAAVTAVDSDEVESTFRERKAEALLRIKQGHGFVKFPSGSQPLETSFSADTYAKLFPVLFPYGVGSFEDNVRDCGLAGFRRVQMKRHVQHLMELADRRFQKHMSFRFVVMNVMQRRKTSFQSRLATSRASYPKVARSVAGIDKATLKAYVEKLQTNRFARAESEKEKEIVRVMRYIDYISAETTGSTAELVTYREEIRALTRVHGTPHFFLTINPADAVNPIRQFLAGDEIGGTESIFDDMDAEARRRSKTLPENPTAGARFFHTMVTNFLDVILGCGRTSRKGILGTVNKYYGVVEAQGRGSLHIHMFIWVEGGLAPNELREKAKADPEWSERFFDWLDDVIKTDFPEGTHPAPDKSV